MGQVETRPRYEVPKITPMDRDEVLQAFQMSAAQISAAGCWWTPACVASSLQCGQPDVRHRGLGRASCPPSPPGFRPVMRISEIRRATGGLMPASPPKKTKTVRGVTLRRDPAREACFTVVQLHKELHDYDDMSETSRRQRLHRHMHNEMQNLEIAAQTLAEFPDAPWELRLQLARQCWDEARHTRLLYRRLARSAATRASSRS